MKKRQLHTSIIPKKQPSIPTDEEFARASRLMEERYRGLDVVRQRVLRHFEAPHRIHDFYISPHGDSGFHALLFLKTDSDIQSVDQGGFVSSIRDYILAQLADVGRGHSSETTLTLELDSDENVHKKYHGNYFNRLR